MAAGEGEDDPAVYRSGKKNANANDEMKNGEDDSEDEDDTLLTVQPGFNRLLLVLRDAGVLYFVKYVSAKAPGSRWDIFGEWEIGQVEMEDEMEDEENGDGGQVEPSGTENS